jgi:predicted RNase H-like nuclease (RuvC/YqgF family)
MDHLYKEIDELKEMVQRQDHEITEWKAVSHKRGRIIEELDENLKRSIDELESLRADRKKFEEYTEASDLQINSLKKQLESVQTEMEAYREKYICNQHTVVNQQGTIGNLKGLLREAIPAIETEWHVSLVQDIKKAVE